MFWISGLCLFDVLTLRKRCFVVAVGLLLRVSLFRLFFGFVFEFSLLFWLFVVWFDVVLRSVVFCYCLVALAVVLALRFGL